MLNINSFNRHIMDIKSNIHFPILTISSRWSCSHHNCYSHPGQTMPFFDNRCYTVDAIQVLVAAGRRAVLFCIPSTTLRYQSRSLQPCYVQLNLLFKDTRHTTICISSTIYLPPYGRHYTYLLLLDRVQARQSRQTRMGAPANKQTNKWKNTNIKSTVAVAWKVQIDCLLLWRNKKESAWWREKWRKMTSLSRHGRLLRCT